MKFDYKVVELTDAQLINCENNLKNYGLAGWEVIDVLRIGTDSNVIIAKRQI